jgi:phage shock protein C
MDEQRAEQRRSVRKLYKSSSDRMVGGVCSGIADYLDVDPSVARLTLVALTIMNFGVGVVFYIVAMMVMPVMPVKMSKPSEEPQEPLSRKSSDGGILIGVLILIVGIVLLFHYYGSSLPWVGIIDMNSLARLALPVVLILIGSVLLMGRERELQEEIIGEKGSSEFPEHFSELAEPVEKKRLFRSTHDVKAAGVCGGLSEYLGADSTLVRLVLVFLVLGSFGMALILYLACALVIPKEKI